MASRFVQGSASARPSIGGISGAAARGDHHGLASHEQVVADPHAALAVEPAGAAHERDPAVLEPRDLARVIEVVDDLVAPREHGRHVEIAGHGLAHAGNPPRLGEQLARAQQGLRRHARVERALAPHQVLLDNRHLEAAVGEPPRTHLARGTRPQDDHVEFALTHGAGTVPAVDGARRGGLTEK